MADTRGTIIHNDAEDWQDDCSSSSSDSDSCSSSSSSSSDSCSMRSERCPPDHQKKCVEIKYELCDSNCCPVPIKIERRLYTPLLGCVEIGREKNGCAKVLCTKIKGWQLCSKSTCLAEGRLEQEVFAPHFKRCIDDREEECHDDSHHDKPRVRYVTKVTEAPKPSPQKKKKAKKSKHSKRCADGKKKKAAKHGRC